MYINITDENNQIFFFKFKDNIHLRGEAYINKYITSLGGVYL